ncbi:hypothetical protein [Lacinutrix salivirga]
MKNLLILLTITFSLHVFSQKEGQLFCEGDPTEGYFPLLKSKKYIIWDNTYYIEEHLGEKTLEGKLYTAYSQTWEAGNVANMFLREEDNAIYQYEANNTPETLRLPKKVKKGNFWKTPDGLLTYKITSIKGTLKTPVCEYKNLLVLKSTFTNGTYTFYYQKGYGYVGATQNDTLISFVVPRLPEALLKKTKKQH